IERISSNCGYPYYFQGLVYQLQGLYDSAAACYQLADKFPVGMGDNTDLACMSALSLEELHALRGKLIQLEDRIYGKYTPNLQPRDMSDPLIAAQETLLADPFRSENYYNCAVALLEAGNAADAAAVVNLGLMQDSDNAFLLNLCGAINYHFAKAQEVASSSDAPADVPADTAPVVSQSDVSGADVSASDVVLPIAAVDYSRIDVIGTADCFPVTLDLGDMQFIGELTAKAALTDGEINQAISKVMQINGMSEGILSSLSAEVNKASVPDGATAEDCAAILALLPSEDDTVSGSDAAPSASDAEALPAETLVTASSDSDITASQSDIASSADADASTALSPADALRVRDQQEKDILFIAKDKIVRAFSFDWFKLVGSHKQYLRDKDNTDLEDAFESKRAISEFYGKVNDEISSMLAKSDKRVCSIKIEHTIAASEAQFYGCSLPETWNVNMSLTREGGAAPGIGGSYTGQFLATVTYDTSSFDASFVEIFKKMNVFSSFWPGMAGAGMTIKDTTIQPTVITRTISCENAVAMLQDNSSSALLSIEGGTDTKSAIINHNETISWNTGAGTVAWGIPVTASGAKLTFVNRAEPAITAGYRGNIGEENKRYDIGWDNTIWKSIDITQPLSIEIG
ncbi:MAG: hypothetical protein IJP17_07045, partial [Clostridia bacterium]|nr:hypothetical protein [Clostridia bacterium]